MFTMSTWTWATCEAACELNPPEVVLNIGTMATDTQVQDYWYASSYWPKKQQN